MFYYKRINKKNRLHKRSVLKAVFDLFLGQHFASENFFLKDFKRFFLGIAIIREGKAAYKFRKVMRCCRIVKKKIEVSAEMELTVFSRVIEHHMRRNKCVVKNFNSEFAAELEIGVVIQIKEQIIGLKTIIHFFKNFDSVLFVKGICKLSRHGFDYSVINKLCE